MLVNKILNNLESIDLGNINLSFSIGNVSKSVSFKAIYYGTSIKGYINEEKINFEVRDGNNFYRIRVTEEDNYFINVKEMDWIENTIEKEHYEIKKGEVNIEEET